MAANAPTLTEILDAAGYTSNAVGSDIIWKISTPAPDPAVRAKIEILERKGSFSITKCVVQINHEKTLERILDRARKRFARVISSSTTVEPDGRMRCVIEIARPKTDVDTRRGSLTGGPGTTIGWTTHITNNANMISAQLTDAFLIGDPVQNWWADVMGCVSEGVTPNHASAWEARHLQELVIAVGVFPIQGLKVIAKLKRVGMTALNAIELPTSLRSTIRDGRTVIESAPASSIMAEETPIEILEARETSGKWRELDLKIRQRKAKRASITDPEVSALDTLARLGAIPELITTAVSESLETSLTNMEHASLLSLTGANVIASRQKRDKDLIRLLSDILRKVTLAYGPLDSIKPLSTVAPEVLGDCWSRVNPEMAFKSWSAALASLKPNPRVQHKIAELARTTNEYHAEYEALMTLAINERRRDGLEIVAPRLIKLANDHPELVSSGDSNYVSALAHIAGVLPNNKQVIMAIVRRLTATGNHRRALTTLESCLASARATLSNADIAELNIAMGDIWYSKEGNTTLATARYMAATTSPAEPSDEILAAAETFFAATNNSTQLRRILRERSEQSDQTSSIAALERSARYLADKNLFIDALRDVTRLLAVSRARQWYLDIIEGAAGGEGINWMDLAHTMKEANVSELPRDSLGAWMLITGRVAHRAAESAQSDKLWVESLTHPQVISLLSEDDSRKIRAYLVKREQLDKLSNFTSARLTFAKKEEYEDLVREIVSVKLTRDDGLFEQAIAEHAASTSSLELSAMRAASHINDRRLKDLRALRQAHVSFLSGSTLLIGFLDLLLRQVANSRDITLAETLEEILADRIAQADLTDEEDAAWTNIFLNCGFLQIAERRLRQDIEHGRLTVKNEDIVSSLFIDDPATMAKWHYLARATQSARARQIYHAAEATRLWLTTDERPSELVSTLEDLASDATIERGKLELLERLCVREKKIETFITTIDRQVTLTSQTDKVQLSHWGIRVIMSQARDPLLAAKYYAKWLGNRSDHIIYDNFAVGRLHYAGDDLITAQKHLISLLSIPEILGEPEILVSAATTLAKCKINRTVFATVIQTLISWSRSAHNNELTEAIIRLSITWHVANLDDLNREFITKFDSEELERLADIATQILAKADQLPNGVQKTIAEWQETFLIVSNREKWLDVICLMTKDRFLGKLRRAARCDLLHIHARNLFENDASRLEAIPFYQAIASENPMDSRGWLPLYSLYEESGACQPLIDHLERIIPLLQRDGAILEKTPFNIESLKNSLRRARELSGSGRGIGLARQTKSTYDPNFQSRAAQMQQAWINSIPAVRIVTAASGDFSDHATDVPPEQPTTKMPQEFDGGEFDGSTARHLAADSFTGNRPSGLEVVDSSQNELPEKSEEQIEVKPQAEDTRDRVDWRDMVLNEQTSIGITERIMTMAFANETEKHVAVQCAALLNAETKALDTWHWPVWRNSGSYDYPLSISGRLVTDVTMTMYGGPLHTLLRMISPIILRARQHKFLIRSRLASLAVTKGVTFTPVTMEHPAISRGGLRYFQSIIDGAKATFCDTTGIGTEVFFDLQTRTIHFDGKWQMGLPPGVLTYKVLEYLTNFQKGHIGMTDLDPETDIQPILEEIKNVLASSGMSRLRIAFGMQHRDINDQLKNVNREQLVSLLTLSGSPSTTEIRRLQTELRLKSLTTILASSLDVIGILESLTGKDLCDANLLTPKKVFEIHPLARALLFAAAKLSL